MKRPAVKDGLKAFPGARASPLASAVRARSAASRRELNYVGLRGFGIEIEANEPLG